MKITRYLSRGAWAVRGGLGIAATLLLLFSSSTLGVASDESSLERMPIRTKASLLHLGSIDSFDITPGGVDAARGLLSAIENDRPGGARTALDIYGRIIPAENFGGEYTALEWFCHYLLAFEADKAKMLEDDLVASYFHFFADDHFATLREYLKRKYKLAKLGDEDSHKARRRLGFLEDFILFNNPVRERWEKSSKMIAALGLKPGQLVADVGCGPGYFSFKFAKLVGPKGRVYAIDTNELHTEYVSGLAKKLGVGNIETVKGDFHDIKVDAKVDCVYMCSLYHIIYATSSESEKDRLIASIKRVMKKDATFVVVDNALVHDETLPYHGPYIDQRLIVGQLRHYGFRLVATHQFIPQRYMLVFKLESHPPRTSDVPVAPTPDGIALTSRASLIHIPNDGLPDVTEGGRQAAKLFLKALESRDQQSARAAIQQYGELIPKEKFGDEYTAFQWFCEYFLASEAERQELRQGRGVAEYYDYFAANDFLRLKQYLKDRYQPDKWPDEHDEAYLRPHVNRDQITFWRDLILFNNPRREQWEQTSKIVEFLKLQPGQCVADVGCGPGYYTWKFAERVGPRGRVYAVDTNEDHLDYVSTLAKKYAPRVETIRSKLNDTRIPARSVDMVFMCSLYSVVYTTSMEMVKDGFVDSIKRALKKGGRLVIVDNAVVKEGQIPYHGPYIAKELVTAQLQHYGFRLVDQAQFIPQRYVLVFELAE